MLELLKKRRSVRRFKKIKIEGEKLEALMKAGLLSPSSRGRSPWEFIFVTDEGLIEKLGAAKTHGSSFLAGAPLGIVVIADPAKCDVWIEDASIASIIIQLAAESLGLSSCWIQVRERPHGQGSTKGALTAEEYVRNVLNISAEYRILCIIAVGYADEPKPQTKENKLDFKKIHTNGF